MTTDSPSVWGKCKSVLLSPITAACLGILFIKDVISYSALMSNLFFFLLFMLDTLNLEADKVTQVLASQPLCLLLLVFRIWHACTYSTYFGVIFVAWTNKS